MEWLIEIWESVKTFFHFIYWFCTEFIQSGEHLFRVFLEGLFWVSLYISEQALIVSYGLLQGFLEDIDFAGRLKAEYDKLPAVSAQLLAFFRIPECINILVSALGTRFVFKMMPLGSPAA